MKYYLRRTSPLLEYGTKVANFRSRNKQVSLQSMKLGRSNRFWVKIENIKAVTLVL